MIATTIFYPKLNRRQFLQGSVGLVIAMSLPVGNKLMAAQQADTDRDVDPNAFIRIAPDNSVTVIIKHIEIGQGAFTGLATLAAEEMDADWTQIRAEHAPANVSLYKNFNFGIQGVGGSSGLANSYEQMRKAGAGARAMLVAAAAEKWDVPVSEITVAKGVVQHSSGKLASFGELAELAAKQSPPDNIQLKKAEQFTLIGTNVPRLDTPAKSDGSAIFTQDKKLDNMLVAVVAHAPAFGASLQDFDDRDAKKVKGVVAVNQIPSGVAVIANNTYAAIRGRDALNVNWNSANAETRSSDEIMAEYIAAARSPGRIAHEHGDISNSLSKAEQRKTVVFEFPYLAHTPMETLDAIVRANKDGTVEAWLGSQLQTVDVNTIAGVFDVGPEQVTLNTLYGGGTFGRRAQPDSGLAAEAAEIARTVNKGVPVKLIWTREDDIHGGRYRPMAVHQIEAGLDNEGNLLAWQHNIATQSIMAGTPFEQAIKDGIDPSSVEGAHKLPYQFEARQTTLHTMQNPIPVLWWRSVGHTHNAYAIETMLDYMLETAEQDPVDGRLALMKDAPREAGVLREAARMAQQAGKAPPGSARGVAVHKSFSTYVAQIAEVTKDAQGFPKVTKVWCAVDCGVAVNTNVVTMQMESGIGFGLGAILREQVTLEKGGRVRENNFDTYQPLRIQDMPAVEVSIIKSDKSPTGVGEPGTPPIGPAVANAWRRLTGEMVTRLPFTRHFATSAQEA